MCFCVSAPLYPVNLGPGVDVKVFGKFHAFRRVAWGGQVSDVRIRFQVLVVAVAHNKFSFPAHFGCPPSRHEQQKSSHEHRDKKKELI